MLRLVLLLTGVSRPHFERACSARQPDIVLLRLVLLLTSVFRLHF